jgi:RNA polymerase sigma-70 factor (ECF subfamily)
MPLQDDINRIRRFRKGDESAFNELVRQYQKPVYQIARRLVGSHEDAEDVAQEAFIKAYRGLRTFREDASFFTWIYRIAVNLSLNIIRRRKLRRMFSLEGVGLSIASRSPAPDESLERDETLRAVEDAIERLPEKQKLVFTLRYHQQLSHTEIARILKRDEGTIKANYHQALKKLRRTVKS